MTRLEKILAALVVLLVVGLIVSGVYCTGGRHTAPNVGEFRAAVDAAVNSAVERLGSKIDSASTAAPAKEEGPEEPGLVKRGDHRHSSKSVARAAYKKGLEKVGVTVLSRKEAMKSAFDAAEEVVPGIERPAEAK